MKEEHNLEESIQSHALWLKTKGEQGSRAVFSSIDFINYTFSDFNFSGMVFKNCNLSNATFIANKTKGIEFYNCNLTSTKFEVSEIKFAKFENCDISFAKFYATAFEKASFFKCNGKEVFFIKSFFMQCEIEDSTLDNINYNSSTIQNTHIKNCEFKMGDFSYCNFFECNFTDTAFLGADFHSVIFKICLFKRVKFVDYEIETNIIKTELKTSKFEECTKEETIFTESPSIIEKIFINTIAIEQKIFDRKVKKQTIFFIFSNILQLVTSFVSVYLLLAYNKSASLILITTFIITLCFVINNINLLLSKKLIMPFGGLFKKILFSNHIASIILLIIIWITSIKLQNFIYSAVVLLSCYFLILKSFFLQIAKR